jgi:hypothetical protein
MTASCNIGPEPRCRAFQFRLGTLLIATTWAGLISFGLRTPTALWSGVIAVLTLLTVFMAALVVMYRMGRTRAMAIGFLVFCVGYLTYLAVLAGTLSSGLTDTDTPVGGGFGLLFEIIHPDRIVTETDSTGFARQQRIRQYMNRDFVAICNHALACLLGIAGAIAAQMLYATQRREAAAQDRQ